MASDEGVVRVQQVSPLPLATLGRQPGRLHDVGEEQSREHAIDLDAVALPGDELLDFVQRGEGNVSS